MASDEQPPPQQLRKLRSQTHALKPVVTIGSAGLSDSVLNELELSLEHHELLKIKLSCGDKTARLKVREQVCVKTGAHLVQEIGGIIVIYRKAQPVIKKAKPGRAISKPKAGKARVRIKKPG